MIRSKILKSESGIEDMADDIESVEVQTKSNAKSDVKVTTLLLLPEFPHRPRKPRSYRCEPLSMPRLLYDLGQKVQAVDRHL